MICIYLPLTPTWPLKINDFKVRRGISFWNGLFSGGILVLERVYLTIECFTSFNLSRMMAFNVAFPVGNDWVQMRDPK